ncbi:MAG TPA: hypothetical protein VL463_32450 [Kofleriaceae bacterium]|nr:hypothetical protein [Kofleriaceae bacterium]
MRGPIIAICLIGACTSAAQPSEPDGGAETASVEAALTTSGTSRYFPAGSWFLQDVSTLPKASNSDAIITALTNAGGWGNSNKMQIDFDLDVLDATSTTRKRAFTKTDDWYSPDCDGVKVPVPTGGNLEGESGYACTGDGDCHLLVHDPVGKKLYEMWRANISGGTFYGGCLAVWDETRAYGMTGRGLQCTSADAAGFPIAPLLFTADEVASGHIDHAIRFVLPNSRIKKGFVPPATHGTYTTGSGNLPYYGVHLRLRANYPISTLSPGAQVVARAMQKYGMYHADGGNIALTAQSDRHTAHKWAGLLRSTDLAALAVSDFEVVDHGAAVPLTLDCVRNP